MFIHNRWLEMTEAHSKDKQQCLTTLSNTQLYKIDSKRLFFYVSHIYLVAAEPRNHFNIIFALIYASSSDSPQVCTSLKLNIFPLLHQINWELISCCGVNSITKSYCILKKKKKNKSVFVCSDMHTVYNVTRLERLQERPPSFCFWNNQKLHKVATGTES